MLEQASLSDSVEIQAAPWVLSIRPVAALREVYRAKLTGSLKGTTKNRPCRDHWPMPTPAKA